MSSHKVLVKCKFIFVIAATSVAAFTVQDEIELLKDLDVTGYAALYNMTLDRVHAVTSDGWRIELHRVRNMLVFDEKLSAPVYISHGCGCSSVDFMVNPRNESLIFMLADLGYDVWAVNYRGNKFSNYIVVDGQVQDPRPKDYYRATWQYMAERDVPAALTKIFDVTGQRETYVIGQSMGATILFAALSETKTFPNEILLYGSLVPVIRFGEDTAPDLRRSFNAAPYIPLLGTAPQFDDIFGRQLLDTTLPGKDALRKYLEGELCDEYADICKVLKGMMESSREDKHISPHINLLRNQLYHTVYPAGVTVMNLFQFGRQYRKKVWEKLDYDEFKRTKITNRQEYGRSKPPKYKFAKISVPLQVYFTRNDRYFGVQTAKSLVRDLNLKESDYVLIEGNKMEHHDVVWGWDARCWVYEHLFARMEIIESERSSERAQFRIRMKKYASQLPYEDGCRSVGRTEIPELSTWKKRRVGAAGPPSSARHLRRRSNK